MSLSSLLLALGAAVFAALLVSCDCRGTPSASSATRSEVAAAARPSPNAACPSRTLVYEGSIPVDASDYKHPVPRGEDHIQEEIVGLDRVITTRKRLRFTLDYPFEKPFEGSVANDSGITLRRIIDEIRAGFRTMYAGATQRDIPGLYNKDVSGPFGRAFHVIGDLVIESIHLCETDGTLEIGIGS